MSTEAAGRRPWRSLGRGQNLTAQHHTVTHILPHHHSRLPQNQESSPASPAAITRHTGHPSLPRTSHRVHHTHHHHQPPVKLS
ncbi:hypothetical protein E2C01_067552 [Portunus trituberculatus]|uniref:Uncharacterized protein n=1 Tax=Portunus trituberculatus TaxID=210409 RepID=A0A5B7HLB5_PORTR|nr:hypothetical protein [Portunus trituberculatus]